MSGPDTQNIVCPSCDSPHETGHSRNSGARAQVRPVVTKPPVHAANPLFPVSAKSFGGAEFKHSAFPVWWSWTSGPIGAAVQKGRWSPGISSASSASSGAPVPILKLTPKPTRRLPPAPSYRHNPQHFFFPMLEHVSEGHMVSPARARSLTTPGGSLRALGSNAEH